MPNITVIDTVSVSGVVSVSVSGGTVNVGNFPTSVAVTNTVAVSNAGFATQNTLSAVNVALAGPLSVNATQVGTYNVSNAGFATQATLSTIGALLASPLSVNATQVGTYDVSNASFATQATLSSVAGYLAAPLSVNATQVGTYAVSNATFATQATLSSANSTLSTITGQLAGSLSVNATQVGTYNVSNASFATENTLSAVNLKLAGTLATSAAQSGTWQVNSYVFSSALPVGAATESTLSAINTKLAGTISVSVTNPGSSSGYSVVSVDNFPTSVIVSDGGGSLTVDGTVAVSSIGTSVTVNGTVAVSGVSGSVTVNDGGGSLTVDGTVAVSSIGTSVTVNGAVSANTRFFDGSSSYIDVSSLAPLPVTGSVIQSGTWAVNAFVFSSALPVGAATESTLGTRLAESTFTARVPVQGQAAMAASIPVAIASDQTAIPVSQSGSWAVSQSGSWAVAATQSGSWAVSQSGVWSVRQQDGSGNGVTSRTLGSAQAQDIAIVDGSGNQITSFGGGTEYTEDAAAAADPVGNALIARRRDSLSTETTTDGDNTALNSTGKGELYVKHVDNVGVTGTLAATQSGAWTVTSNQGGSWNVGQSGTWTVGISAGQTIAATQAGTWNVGTITAVAGTVTVDTELPAAATIAADAVTPTVPGAAGYMFVKTPGANTWDRAYAMVNAANTTGTGIQATGMMAQFDDVSPTAITENQFGNVRMSANRNVFVTLRDAAGNERGLNIDASNQIGTVPAGGVAHDGVDSGNPLKVGARAVSLGATPTAVAAADRTDVLATRAGQLFVLNGHPNIVTVEAEYTAAQTNTAVVTVSAGTKIVVLGAEAVCASSNSVATSVRLGFGTASTPTTTGVFLTHGGIASGSGLVKGYAGCPIGIGADDEDVRITCSVPTGGNIRVVICYFTIAG